MSERSTCDECFERRKLKTYNILRDWDGSDIVPRALCNKCRAAMRHYYPRCSFWMPHHSYAGIGFRRGKYENTENIYGVWVKRTWQGHKTVWCYSYKISTHATYLIRYENSDKTIYEKLTRGKTEMEGIKGWLRKIKD
jgi:hypothetical protein